MSDQSSVLWQPSQQQIANAKITGLKRRIENQYQVSLNDYQALHAWSVNNLSEFWSEVWDFCEVVASHRGERVVIDADRMPGAKWFPDAKLNYAQNLLKRRGTDAAVVFRSEDAVARTLSWNELHDQVAAVAAYLTDAGVEEGDRVVGFMPNMPETIVAMLAAASLGAVWSSCSPDFGEQGVVDRFGQIEPKVLFTADGYFYNGKFHDSLARVSGFLKQLPSVQQVVVVPFRDPVAEIDCSLPNGVLFRNIVVNNNPPTLQFKQLPFDHPLYVMYSSGTTGAPKCIVHSAGGALLQHLKEMHFHCNLSEGERIFYFTTCGWMMWNWLVSGSGSRCNGYAL